MRRQDRRIVWVWIGICFGEGRARGAQEKGSY